MMIDRKKFYDAVRPHFPGKALTVQQVAGMDVKLTRWEALHQDTDLRFLANMLSQNSWETGWKMVPLKEAYFASDANRRAYLMKSYDISGSNPERARKNGNTTVGDGVKYAGAGDIQITWKNMYRKAGEALGSDLVNKPHLALDPVVSAEIMFWGMIGGHFTGRKLSQYFNATTDDPVAARAIVNGDRGYPSKMKGRPASWTVGQEIGERHHMFLRALRGAVTSGIMAPVQPAPSAKPAVLVVPPAVSWGDRFLTWLRGK